MRIHGPDFNHCFHIEMCQENACMDDMIQLKYEYLPSQLELELSMVKMLLSWFEALKRCLSSMAIDWIVRTTVLLLVQTKRLFSIERFLVGFLCWNFNLPAHEILWKMNLHFLFKRKRFSLSVCHFIVYKKN